MIWHFYQKLERIINMLYDYCHRLKLTINTEKTCMIIFRKGGNVTEHDHLFFGDGRLNLLDKISYLSLTLSVEVNLPKRSQI